MRLSNFTLYFKRVNELLMDPRLIDSCSQVVSVLHQVILSGNSIYVCGNGGSAATANHFVNDLISIRAPDFEVSHIKAFSLCSNSSVLTCLANDFSYEFIFSKQLKSFLKDGDVVVGISASGNSSNIINSMLMAQQNGAVSVGITGFDGGGVKKTAQYNIYVPSIKGEYGPVEDAHSVICHALSSSLKSKLEGTEGWVFPHVD